MVSMHFLEVSFGLDFWLVVEITTSFSLTESEESDIYFDSEGVGAVGR